MESSKTFYRRPGLSHSFDMVVRRFVDMGEDSCLHAIIDRPGGTALTLVGDQVRWLDANGNLRWSCFLCGGGNSLTLGSAYTHLYDRHDLGPRS